MNSERTYQVTIGILTLIILLLWNSVSTTNDKLATTEMTLDQYKSAVLDANSIIENAKTDAWSDYQTMGTTLENLETVDPESY